MGQPSPSHPSSGKRSKKKHPTNSSTQQPVAQPSAAKHIPTKPPAKKPVAPQEVKPTPAQTSQPSPPAAPKREQQLQRREAASQRTQQQQRRKRRRRGSPNRGLWLTLGGVLVAVAGIIALFIVLGRQSPNTSGTYPSTAADPTVIKQVTSVDPSVLAQVGTGSGKVLAKPAKQTGTTLLTGPTGKPEVFYYGAEFCPYCATDRWPLIVALSRFGTFSNLRQITSSSSDVYPSTHTFTFYQSSYSSHYIDFVPLEQESYQGVVLETPNAAQQQILNQFNPSGYPFISFANQYLVTSASYDPQVLSNLDWQQIAGALSNPQSPIAQGVLGAANYMTAAICATTNQQPASVCQAAPIPEVQQSLTSSTGNVGQPGSFLATLVADAPAAERRGR